MPDSAAIEEVGELSENTPPDESAVLSEALLDGPQKRRRRRRRRHRVRRVVRLGLYLLGGLLVLGLVQLVWAGINLAGIDEKVNASRAALNRGELDHAELQMAAAHDIADRARWGTVGPHLWLAELLPVVGDDVDAIRGVAAASRSLTGDVAEDFFAIRTTLDPEAIRPVDGQVDLARLAEGARQVGEIEDRLVAVERDYLESVGGRLIGPLADVVDRFTEEVTGASDSATFVSGVLDKVPTLLGADGPRRYLLIFQNNAEFRATGGIPGAFAVITADEGRLQMRDQGNAIALGTSFDEPAVKLTTEELRLFESKLAEWPQDVNFTPDFPRSGEILRAMWDKRGGPPLDGVFSVDPVALSRVLEGTGPMRIANGKTATAQNAAQLLMNQPYLEYPTPVEQDAFFEESAKMIFGALIKGEGDAGRALEGLHDALEEGRVLAWLGRPDEQERIAVSQVSGQLERSAGESPDVGVFLNDATATKLDFYISSQTSVAALSCAGDGGQRLHVRTTMSSLVPPNALVLPDLLVGREITGVRGEVLTTVLAYGPVGSRFTSSNLDGVEGAPLDATHQGHPVNARTVLLEPGQTRVLDWMIETGPNQRGAPELRVTPDAHTTGVGRVSSSAC